MRVFRLEREQWFDLPIDTVFDFFADAGNLEQITPPWLHFRILTPRPIPMRQGARIAYRLRWHGIPLHWLTEITVWQPPFRFVDSQRQGPYSQWIHEHTFEKDNGGTRMRDVVDYAVPLGSVGVLAQRWFVGRDVEAIFDYRSETIGRWLLPAATEEKVP